jgi:hypothetical protein
VVSPAGGASSPQGIYCDGTNIQFSTTPLTVSISQAPTASTIVERDNQGNVLGKYFNGNTALENPTVGAVIVQNSAADGYFRKQSLANFIASLFTGNLVTVTTSGNETTYNFGGKLIVKIGLVAQTVAANQTHNFAVAFPNACTGVVPAVADSTGVEFFGLVSSGTSKTGFEIYANNTCNVSYIALGN